MGVSNEIIATPNAEFVQDPFFDFGRKSELKLTFKNNIWVQMSN